MSLQCLGVIFQFHLQCLGVVCKSHLHGWSAMFIGSCPPWALVTCCSSAAFCKRFVQVCPISQKTSETSGKLSQTSHAVFFPRPLKVWSTVKIRGRRVPQKAIVPVGRPRPYSIIILNMRFIPKASLRASSQITASSYILERHLWVNNSKLFALAPTWSLACKQTDCITAGCWNCLTPNLYWHAKDFLSNIVHLFNVYSMLDQRRRRWPSIKTALDQCPV